MQTSSKVAAVVCALTLGGMLSVATPSASAQAGDSPMPAPAPPAKIKVSTWRKIRNYFGAISAERVPHNRVYRDPSTGRTDLPASSRPWVPPNR